MSRRGYALFVVLAALAILLAMAVPSAAREVRNSSTTGYELNAWWSDDFGDHNVGMADTDSWQGIWVSVSTWEECEAGPDDFRSINLNIGGQQYGDLDPALDFLMVEPTKGKNKLMAGDGQGQVWVGVSYYDECADVGFEGEVLAELTLGMDGYGSLGKSRSTDSTHFPADSNEHSSMQSTFRMATADVTIDFADSEFPGGGMTLTYNSVDGSITSATWKSHSNKK
ncbi:MAG: hypothetical protein ACR2NG_08345 [Acidimicrobiia bacterium]